MARSRDIAIEPRYRSPRKRRGRAKVRIQPPMTPMIDVTFQLLLFFLMTAAFRNEGNIASSIPQSGDVAGPPQIGQIVVFVIVGQEGAGDDARPVYAIRKLGRERQIEVPKGLPAGEYKQQMALGLYEELARVKSDVQDPKLQSELQVIIRPEVDPARFAEDQRPYVRWEYVVDAYNQATRVEFAKIGFQWQAFAGEGAF